jgi:hypothetical protein
MIVAAERRKLPACVLAPGGLAVLPVDLQNAEYTVYDIIHSCFSDQSDPGNPVVYLDHYFNLFYLTGRPNSLRLLYSAGNLLVASQIPCDYSILQTRRMKT